MSRSANQLLQACFETAAGTFTLPNCKLWLPVLTAASVQLAPAQAAEDIGTHCSRDNAAATLIRQKNSFVVRIYAGLTPFWMGSRSTPSERCWASAMMTVCCCVPEGCQRPCTTQAAESKLSELPGPWRTGICCCGRGVAEACTGWGCRKGDVCLREGFSCCGPEGCPGRVCMTSAGCQPCVRMHRLHRRSWLRLAACHAGTFCSVLECQARCQLSELFSMPSLSMPCGDMQSVHLCSMMCRRSLLLTLASAALEQQLNDSSNLMISAPCIPDLYQPVSPCSSSGPTSMGLMKCQHLVNMTLYHWSCCRLPEQCLLQYSFLQNSQQQLPRTARQILRKQAALQHDLDQ